MIRGRKKRFRKRGKEIKTWKLKDIFKRRLFEERVSNRIEGANIDQAGLLNALLYSAREVWRDSWEETEIEKNGGEMRKYS